MRYFFGSGCKCLRDNAVRFATVQAKRLLFAPFLWCLPRRLTPSFYLLAPCFACSLEIVSSQPTTTQYKIDRYTSRCSSRSVLFNSVKVVQFIQKDADQ
jgi:hypothetical protein